MPWPRRSVSPRLVCRLHLFLVVVAISARVNAAPADYDVFARAGRSPTLTRLTPTENAQLQATCGRFTSTRRARKQEAVATARARRSSPRLMIENGAYAQRGELPWAASLSHNR